MNALAADQLKLQDLIQNWGRVGVWGLLAVMQILAIVGIAVEINVMMWSWAPLAFIILHGIYPYFLSAAISNDANSKSKIVYS